MAEINDITYKKWNIIKEQLMSLCALNFNSKNNGDIKKALSEDLSLKHINAQLLISICYFLLGVIDAEERDQLIKWPITNIQTNTKFRKGLSVMVLHFQEKYPWAHIKKLPESYFVTPHASQKKLVDFILRLTNLAIHLVLNDCELLMMNYVNGLNEKEIKTMIEVVSKATQKEEKGIKENIISIEEFEALKIEITDQCIFQSEQNTVLEQSINQLYKCAVKDNIIKNEKDGIEGLKAVKEQKLSELVKINTELLKYNKANKEYQYKVNAVKNPVCLMAKDFNWKNSTSTLVQETQRVCENLHKLFQNISSSAVSREEELRFYEKLVLVKNALKEENEMLKTFISKMSPSVQ